MSNVPCIAWRIPCPGLRAWSSPSSSQAPLRPAVRGNRVRPGRPFSIYSRSLLSRDSVPRGPSYPIARRLFPLSLPFPFRSFSAAGCLRSQDSPSIERGVPLRSRPFSAEEINAIFGHDKLSPEVGNRALSILQGRRVAGTLDLDLPSSITQSISQQPLDTALEWLRQNHPMDEDAAIIARFEREEREEEAKLIRRAEELGLYKPQSGSYDSELDEKGDVSGKSVLKEQRKLNEVRTKEREERQRREWLEGEAKDQEKLKQHIQKNTALQEFQDAAVAESRPRADPKDRPLLAWIQKHHLRATEMDVDPSSLNTTRRLLPSLGLAVLIIGGCYAFAKTYEIPAKGDRMFPKLNPAGAAVLGLISINLGVFALWRFPPAWKMLNRYFLSVPMYPRALSMVGSIFSHQQFKHLAINSFILFMLGPMLHDGLGRGQFLGTYMASGVFGSFTSLAAAVLAGRLQMTSLGASGALCGATTAFLVLHPNADFAILHLLPREWREAIPTPGWILAGIAMGLEVVHLASPWKLLRIDHWGHLGGHVAGLVSGLLAQSKAKEIRRNK